MLPKKLANDVLALWREHKSAGTLPTSARFLFYELVARRIVSKHATGARRADQDAGSALTWLREKGLIPWEDVIDETRSLDDFTGAKSVTDWIRSVLEQACIDPWDGDHPIILCESRSLAGVLRSVAHEYRVQIASTNGQCAGFLHTEIGPRLYSRQRVLYFGDLDFSGGHIEANTRRVLERKVATLEWERLALTPQQAKRYRLTAIQKYDARTKRYHPAIETEALSQAVIVDLLRRRLDFLIPKPLSRVQEQERREQRRMRRILDIHA